MARTKQTARKQGSAGKPQGNQYQIRQREKVLQLRWELKSHIDIDQEQLL